MAPTTNKSLIFKAVPETFPEAGKHLVVEDRPLDLDSTPLQGGLLLKTIFASFDPYERGRMRDASKKSYVPAFELDKPITSAVVAQVVRSETPEFAAGDVVAAFYGQNAQYAVVPEPYIRPMGVRKIDNPHNLPLSYWIGVLGMPGTTAFEGLYEIGQPKAGETIFISSAAGAVGQVVGQLAKAEGLTVIGSAGSAEKVEFIKSLGFDHAFNYKEEKPADALARLAPEGIDIYWDNVGGETLDAALNSLKRLGRIIACGSIGDYNSKPEDRYGVKNTFNVVTKNLRYQGFIVDLSPPKYKAMLDKVTPLLADGSIKIKEHVTDGIDKAAEGLIGIFKGDNFGKAVLKVAEL